ncbi:PQQ-like beta-propeller repeat protein [bacterium]|nr:PQQ-like beta-propeller repeat protein [bacterium]
MMVRSFLVLAVATSLSIAGENDWPQFRGHKGSGVSSSILVPTEWEPGKNVAWSITIPGGGYSSPVIWKDRLFLTTAVPDKAEGEAPRGMRAESVRYAIPDITYDWRVLCLSTKDGKLLWQRSVKVGKASKGKHAKNSYATETPCTDGQRLYVYFSQVGLLAMDLDGHPLWQTNIGAFDTYLEYGTSSSPITDGQRVYLQCDNQEKSFVAAYDAQTGKEVWRESREEITSWSTPLLWESTTRTELVTVAPKKARSYDPATGMLLWELGGMSDYTVPIPVADRQTCYISSGFLINPRNRPIFAVRAGASGDITLTETLSSDSVAWRNPLGGPYIPSPILYHDRLFVVHDRPLFDSLSLTTGKPAYPRQRLPSGNFTASPVAYRGKILCLTEEGVGYVIDAGASFRIESTNPALDEDGLFLATPALDADSLYLRGYRQLHCVRSSAQSP